MSFRDAFNRRRTPGYAGGTLEDQLLRELEGFAPQDPAPTRPPPFINVGKTSTDAGRKIARMEGLATEPGLDPDEADAERRYRAARPFQIGRSSVNAGHKIARMQGLATEPLYVRGQQPQQPNVSVDGESRRLYHDIGEIPVHTKPGGLEMYSNLDVKQGERPVDAIRRADMQRAAIGLGDPVKGGEATFAPPDDRRLNLDYVPTGERTRARRVNDVPMEEMAAPVPQSPFKQAFNRKPVESPEQEGFGSSGEPFGSARQRRTQPRDVIADDAQYLRDLQTQPRNWKDKVVDVADAISAGFGNKPRTTMTKRERQIAETEKRLGTELTVGQKQNAIQAGQMVPVTLEDGTVVEVPARSAGNVQSQQQRIRQLGDQAIERKRVNSARIERWERMEARDRKRLLADLYKSGGTNDPEQLEYIADQLGIPGALRPKFIQGQMRDAVDADGNLVQINRQTQEVLSTGEKSYETTKEAGRDRRAAASVAARGTGRGGKSGGMSPSQVKAANALAAKYNYLRKVEMSTDVDPKQKPEIQRQREAIWQQVMDTYPGMFEADEKTFELRPKASSDLDSPVYGKPVSGKPKLNEATVRQAAIDAGLDPDEAVLRARAKGRL